MLAHAPNPDMHDALPPPIRLIDLGSARVCRMEGLVEFDSGMTPCEGSISYAAPEVLSSSYSTRSDVWSLGVMMYTMLAGRLPFGQHGTFQERRQRIMSSDISYWGPAWKRVSKTTAQMVQRMLSRDVYERPSIIELLSSLDRSLNIR